MRGAAFGVLACTLGVAVCSCRSTSTSHRTDDVRPVASSDLATAPSASALTALQLELQTKRLALPPRRRHLPRLAFGAGAVGRLRDDALQVLDDRTLEELATVPLEQPSALVAMADGALVAVGSGAVVRWERGKRVGPPLARLMLLPGAEIYPDARQGDLLWVLEPDATPPLLRRYRLGETFHSGIMLAEQTIELAGPRGGTFGVTREGVWLYVTPGRAERFAPSGLGLPGLRLADAAVPSWSLPARRVDQSLWLDEAGTLTRALVSPVFKSLARVSVPGATYAADVGDEGRLVALVVVAGAGPRFELALLDGELRARGRATLPAESPTGGTDWVAVVTRNQELAVAPRGSRVAVGGPDRLAIYDELGKLTLSIGIR
jgi:hypothetical protein